MKKYLPRIIASIIALVLVLNTGGFLFPETAQATHIPTGCPPGYVHSPPGDPRNGGNGDCDLAGTGGSVGQVVQNVIDVVDCAFSPLACALRNAVMWIMEGVLKVASLITGLAAVMLNAVIYYTIVDVADNYANITAIDTAWTAVRDLANMFFIFLLLYAAIRIILGWGEDSKRLIVNIIIVAILINFSLFFTKIVIDASNVLALFFYSALNPNITAPGFALTDTGLSNSFMQHMRLTSIFNASGISMSSIFTIGVMGTMMLMVAAFSFFSVAIMFIVRYVILILVLILSPLAFLSYAFPSLRDAGSKWLNALIGQAFFAPIYLMITWIALSVLSGVSQAFDIQPGAGSDPSSALAAFTNPENAGQGVFSIFANFFVVIIFIMASLTIAKAWANRAGSGVQKINKWALGAAGAGAFGATAWAGRQTIGRGANWIAENDRLKTIAEDKNANIAARMASRLTLAAGRKGARAGFDVRGTALGGALEAGKPGTKKGYEGFVGSRKAYAEKQAKVAESYAPSEKAKARAKSDYDDAVNKFGAESPQALEAKKNRDQIWGNKEEVQQKVASAEAEKQRDLESKKEKGRQAMQDLENKEKIASQTVAKLESELETADFGIKVEKLKELDTARDKLKTLRKEKDVLKDKIRNEAEYVGKAYDTQIEAVKRSEIQSADKVRKEAFAKRMENSILGKMRGYNYAAAAQVRKGSKSTKDKLAEAAKEYSEELEGGEKTEKPAPEEPAPEANQKAA